MSTDAEKRAEVTGYIDTREGWRKVNLSEYYNARKRHETTLVLDDNPGSPTFWVREEPVPPLPTEVGVSIETTREGTSEKQRWFCSGAHWWLIGSTTVRTATDLAASITGFEVLAEPCSQHYGHEDLEKVRRETAAASEQEAWVDAAEYAALGYQLDDARAKLARIATAVDSRRALDGNAAIQEVRAVLADLEPDPWTSPLPLVDQPEGSTR